MTYLEVLAIAMAVVLCVLMLLGFPVAFTLAGTALLFAGLGMLADPGLGTFLAAIPQRIYGTMTNEVLIAIPLFLLMGVLLERSKIAENLIVTLGRLLRGVPGGLAVGVTLVGALLAASTGVVGATVVTLGLLALPPMLRAGYAPWFATGSIAASGTLGQIIPPSIVLVVLGDQLSVAQQRAEFEKGNFAPETVSVGDLFAGAVIPGLVLVGLFIAFQIFSAWLNPKIAPPATADAAPLDKKGLGQALIAPVTLVVAVLGSILGGLATPTEAASVGAVGGLLLAGRAVGTAQRPIDAAAVAGIVLFVAGAVFDLRLGAALTAGRIVPLALAALLVLVLAYGIWRAILELARQNLLAPVLRDATRLTAMIFTIVIGSSLFSLVFIALGGEELVANGLSALPGGTTAAIAVVMFVVFLLGFPLDFIEITFIVVPIVAPILLKMEGVDAVWLGIMLAVNLQTSFLTPPLGPSLFYLQAVAPGVPAREIYRGAWPFIAIQVVGLGVLWLFPGLATFLPRLLGGP